MASPGDTIIVLMGATGTGKSNLITKATIVRDNVRVGHGLGSCTRAVQAVEFPHPITGKPYVLVDTPGFDEATGLDDDILAMIAKWLNNRYPNGTKLAGIIYLQRISDNRITCPSPLKNLTTFKKLCGDGGGDGGIGCVVLTTTMWDKTKTETAEGNEIGLKDRYWSDMLRSGSKMTRFRNTFNSAWETIDDVVKPDTSGKRQAALLNPDLVKLSKNINATEQGKNIRRKLEELLEEQRDIVRQIRAQTGHETESIAQYEKLEKEVRAIILEMESMTKVKGVKRLREFFSFKKMQL